jgi:Ca-activated chloride channel homolog
MEAKVRLDHELLAVETDNAVHVMLELTAPPAPEGRPRPPLHLALVIDRSGSMGGRKIEVTRGCAAFLARRLSPTDELAIMTFDDVVELAAPLGPVGDGHALLGAIRGIEARGSTNLSGGWLKGMESVRKAPAGEPRKVLLLTDGLANVGVTDPAALTQMTGQAAADGVGTTTIGFGEDFSEELLTVMADAGRGNAHFAATPDDAPGIFAQEFEGLVSLVAQNVSVEVRPSEQVELLGVLNDYPAVAVAGGVQIQMGDAYGGERRRVVLEMHVPSVASLGVATVADLVVRYVSVGQEIAMHELTVPVVVNLVSSDEAAASGEDREVVEEVVVLMTARAQEEARKAAESGDVDKARMVLGAAAARLRSMAAGSARAEELMEQADQMELHDSSLAAGPMSAMTKKQMLYDSMMRKRGRRPPPLDAQRGSPAQD